MADSKISALTAASAVTADDLLPIVNDPGGTPANQKATAAQILAYIESAIGTAAFRALLDDASAAAMRTTLGLAIGTDVQAYDGDLAAIAALTTTSYGRALLELADAAALRTAASLGTIATQAASSVSITGGSITGITDLAVADGGTGASTAAGARSGLGVNARATFSNANYTATAGGVVAQTGTMSAPRTVTLPAASALNAGETISIKDESGTVSAANTLTIARAGSDTIDGSSASLVMTVPYGQVVLYSDGTSGWELDRVTPLRGGAVTTGRLRISSSNCYTLPGVVPTGNTGTSALVAGRLFYHPVLVDTRVTLTDIACEVTTGAASAKGRIGIYSADTDWAPLALVSGTDAAELDFSSIGEKAHTGLSIALAAGRYYLVILSDSSSVSVRLTRGTLPGLMYQATLSGNVYITSLFASQSYGALPSTPPVIGTASGANAPSMDYRVFIKYTPA